MLVELFRVVFVAGAVAGEADGCAWEEGGRSSGEGWEAAGDE